MDADHQIYRRAAALARGVVAGGHELAADGAGGAAGVAADPPPVRAQRTGGRSAIRVAGAAVWARRDTGLAADRASRRPPRRGRGAAARFRCVGGARHRAVGADAVCDDLCHGGGYCGGAAGFAVARRLLVSEPAGFCDRGLRQRAPDRRGAAGGVDDPAGAAGRSAAVGRRALRCGRYRRRRRLCCWRCARSPPNQRRRS